MWLIIDQFIKFINIPIKLCNLIIIIINYMLNNFRDLIVK